MPDTTYGENTYIDFGDRNEPPSADASHLQAAGRGDALLAANQQRENAACALQALAMQAPTLRATLGEAFQTPPGRAPGSVVEGAVARAQEAYWSARMPGTAGSRQAYAATLLRQHFMASQDIALGLDKIGAKAWAQGRQQGLEHAALAQWRHDDGTGETCASALLFAPPAGQTQWLLYRPEANMPVRSFQHQEALQAWLHEHRRLLWPTPATALEDASDSQAIVLQTLSEDGFSRLQQLAQSEHLRLAQHHLEQHSGTDPLPWADIEAWEPTRFIQPQQALPAGVQQAIDARVDEDAAWVAQELHFDSLPDTLPSAWRQQRIERQQALLAVYLGDHLAPDAAPMTTLRTLRSRLETVQASQSQLLADLPAEVAGDIWGQHYGDTSRFVQLSDNLRRALHLEAELQHLLGDLSASHLSLIEQITEMPEPNLQRQVRPCALQLVVDARHWYLTGFLTLHSCKAGDADAPDTSLLLYKPGDNGGLIAFADAAQLSERLLETLQGSCPQALLESLWPQDIPGLMQALEHATQAPSIAFTPIDTHFFDYCMQTLVASLAPADDSSVSVPREAASARLRISVNRARLLAFERHAERNRTANLAARLHPLQHLDLAKRSDLARATEALRQAMLAHHQLLHRDLPERSEFALARLEQRLRADFAPITMPAITLNMADRVVNQRVSLGESGQANAYKMVKAFSEERSDIALEHLLLWALDDDLTLRLGDATIAFEGGSGDEALRLGVNQSYVANLVRQLDIAGAYERQILETFNGLPQETPWQAELRQETVRAPFQQQLQIIAASYYRGLDVQGQQLLEQFAHEQLGASANRTVTYHTLVLKPGTASDGSSAQTTLSGIFVLQADGYPTLLLLPEAPNNRIVSQYPDAAHACQALADMALDEPMRSYLAKLPIDGDEHAHLSYINSALQANYSGFIGLGITRSETLPTLLANLQMGRLVLHNRATSRSQADLYLETEAIRHGRVYDYIKMALGVVPLVGTAVALYDGWHAATASVEAFLRSDPGAGIDHLNSVFLCLTDALLDLTPTVLFNNPSSAARLATLQRQRLTMPRSSRLAQPRYQSPFSGYETDIPTGRWVDHPAAHGAGVYRHIDSGVDYIIRQGRYYSVSWDDTYRTWRLQGNGRVNYPLPVKRAAHGTWESHGRLSGQLIDSGLAGGGAQLSALYNRGWATLRDLLRRQPAIASPLQVLQDIHLNQRRHQGLMKARLATYNQAQGVGPNGPVSTPAAPAAIAQALREATEQAQVYVTFAEHSLERLRALRANLKRADYSRFQQELALDLSKQNILLMKLHRTHLRDRFQHTRQLFAATDGLAEGEVPAHLRHLHSAHDELAEALQRLEADVYRHERIRGQLKGTALTEYDQHMQQLEFHLEPQDYRILGISSRIVGIFEPRGTFDHEVQLFLRQMNREIVDLRSALFSHGELRRVVLSRREESRFLTHLQARYQRFQAHLRSWQDEFPDFVSASASQRVDQELSKLSGEIDASLSAATPPVRQVPRSNRGASKPRLFETVDEQLLIGRETTVDGQSRMQVSQLLDDVPHASFSPAADGRWHRAQVPPLPPLASLQVLEHTANSKLAKVVGQTADLQRYKALNMLPRDLQDLAEGHAASLRELATDLARKAGDDINPLQHALVERLEQHAKQLDSLGRTLRIEQTKASPQPTISYLEYLKEQGEIELHWSRELEPARNKQGQPLEYLEEYRIDDVATGQALWYAHFHFKKKPGNGFARLEAGHIKLASERNQKAGAWRGAVNEAQAVSHFANLRPE